MEHLSHISKQSRYNIVCLGILFILVFLFSSVNAETHYYEFHVQATQVERLCRAHNIITVNGQFPGPTLEVSDGDTLVIKVVNFARYNVTLHWHGVHQMRTPWVDGPEYVTQCPIQPGASYTYRFTIENQVGTLWWHAHSRWLRATIYGALVIRPKLGVPCPFPKPTQEIPILLGEWWDGDIISVLQQAILTGGAPNVSDAYTINGQPGDLYRCSSKETTKVYVKPGETVLLRIINAALNQDLFFAVANHTLTVVESDAAYNRPFRTKVIMLGPGQTTNVLLTANQPVGRYYMATRAYAAQVTPFDNTTATAILEYAVPFANKTGVASRPLIPALPAFNDTATVTAFTSQLRSLPLRKIKVPTHIDENLFFTLGLGVVSCTPGPRCIAASINNISFVLPRRTSLLQAYYQNIPDVYTTDFPPLPPPLTFDYTGNLSTALSQPLLGTKLYKLKFGSNVQIVLQDTAIVPRGDHPMHLHGYHFYVVGQGFGVFNPSRDAARLNLVDPPLRNTINVPVKGWAVIRFAADNPGVWLMHCHIDSHLTWGMAMAFLVENGPRELQSIRPPPPDLPPC